MGSVKLSYNATFMNFDLMLCELQNNNYFFDKNLWIKLEMEIEKEKLDDPTVQDRQIL